MKKINETKPNYLFNYPVSVKGVIMSFNKKKRYVLL